MLQPDFPANEVTEENINTARQALAALAIEMDRLSQKKPGASVEIAIDSVIEMGVELGMSDVVSAALRVDLD